MNMKTFINRLKTAISGRLQRRVMRFRIQRCRNHFNSLPSKWQDIYTNLGYDPESKIKRGDFNA